MNLNRLMFWKSPAASKTEIDEQQSFDPLADESSVPQAAENVIDLPIPPAAAPAEPEIVSGTGCTTAPRPAPRGLLDDPRLKQFFEIGHFGHGRYNGTHCRTQEALETGMNTIIAEFQNVVTEVLEQKVVKAHRFEDAQIETEGVCKTTTARLRVAKTHLEREIAELRAQVELAGAGRGWVLAALNSYQQGFRLGVKSAVEFDLLTQ